MARLPDADDLGGRPIPQSRARFVPSAQPGADIGAGLQSVANAGYQIRERQDKLAYAKAKSDLLLADLKTRTELESDPDYESYEKRYRERMKKAREGVTEQLRSPSDRALFEQDADFDVERGALAVQGLAKRKEIDTGRATLDGVLTTNRTAALESKDAQTRVAFVDTARDALDGARAKGYITAQEDENLWQGWKASYGEGYLDTLPLTKQIELLAKPAGTEADFIAPDRRANLLKSAQRELQAEQREREREMRERRAEARDVLQVDLADAFAARANGIPAKLPDKQRFVAAFEDGASRYQDAAETWDVYDVVAGAVNQSPVEAAATLETLKPKGQTGAAKDLERYDLASRLWQQQRKQLEDDPVGTLLARNPKLAAQAQTAGSPEDRASYLRTLRARQETLEIAKPRLLPNAVRDQVASGLTFDPEKPRARMENLQALRDAYGRDFPQVVAEIAPKLDGHARVLVNMTPDDGARLDAAIAQDPEKVAKLMPEGAASDMKNALQREFEPLEQTLADNPDAESRLIEHREAALVLAQSYVLRGSTPVDAARDAADAVVNNRYEYRNTMRIPDVFDPDHIQGAAATKLRDVVKQTLKVAPGAYSDAHAAQADIREHVDKQGYWITNEDETGLVLRIPHRSGQGEVYGENGDRIEVTWAQLLAMPAAAPRDPFSKVQ